MSEPAETRSLPARLAMSLPALALGVFFVAMGTMILRSPITGPAWAAWLLRGFVLLVFGSIGLGSLSFAWSTARGRRPLRLPRVLLERCPACGEPFSERGACHEHRETRDRCREAWCEDTGDTSPSMLFFGAAMGGGILCLGLFMGGWALFPDEPQSTFTILASIVLALLLISVGGVLAVGGLAMLHDALGSPKRYVLALESEGRAVAAAAEIRHGVLQLSGTEHWHPPIAEAPAPEIAPERLSPPLLALARAVAALHARGEAKIGLHQHRSWKLSASGEVTRTGYADVWINVAENDDTDAPEADAGRRLLLAALHECESLTRTAQRMAEQPALADAAEAFAASLAPEAVDLRLAAILAGVLGAPPPVTAYRSGG